MAHLESLLLSKNPDERQLGQGLTHLEYDNLVTALKLAVAAHVSIYNLYGALTNYLNMIQDQQRGLELGQFVLSYIEAYPQEILQGPLGSELTRIFGDTATRQLNLKHYSEAETLYQKVLQLIAELKQISKQEQGVLQASTYHNLGMVAQEQREWEQAKQYYQHALQVFIDFNARYEQAKTYHQLGIVAKEQREWEQAKQYYQHALQINIDFNDRYEQASTYHNLGMVAQEQREWEQAKQYYQHALQINIDFNARYEQASTYHNLGIVAQEQREWEQAKQYYQHALQIKIDFNARYEQAGTYHQLGIVAQEQREWEQAKQYYQHALQIKIDFNARYEQASTYHKLGRVAQEQREWEQAKQYYQQALELFVLYNDDNSSKPLFRLAQIWKATDDADLPIAIASVINLKPEEVEQLFREFLKNDDQ